MKKLFIIFILLVFVTGCGDSKKTVTVASKPHSEQYVLAKMLTLMIEKHTDIKVVEKLGIGGGTSNIHPGMISGDIDIYPEYTGTGWLFVLKQKLINDPNKLYEAVKKEYEQKFKIKWMGMYGFNNTYAMAVKEEIASKMGLQTYSDLAVKSSTLILGSEYDFFEREDGYPGLKSTYGFNFKSKKEMDIGLKYKAISAGQVDVINAFSTDGLLKQYKLKVLRDDKNFFPSYHAATLIRMETLKKYPELNKVLEKLTGKISDDEMTRMNYLVEKEKQDPLKVAKDFLMGKGLL